MYIRGSVTALALASSIAAISITPPAEAADLWGAREAGSIKDAPYVAPFSWTGFYGGVNAGYAWSDINTSSAMAPGTHLSIPANLAAVSFAGTGSANDGGFTGGVQAGYNWQIGTFLFGIEGDFNALAADTTQTGAGILTTGDTFVITNQVETNWFATIRGRLGLTAGRSLFYVTGGAAFVNRDYTQSYSDTLLAAVGSGSTTETDTGWTVGGGLEYAFDNNWTVKGEYLFARFDNIGTSSTVLSTSGGTNALSGSSDLDLHIVRAGINYKF